MFLRIGTKRRRLIFQWGLAALVTASIVALLLMSGILEPLHESGNKTNAGSTITSVLSRPRDIKIRLSFKQIENPTPPFKHFPASRHSLLPEDMGSGLAWGDYDNDGDPDLFLVNFKHGIVTGKAYPQTGRHALYRNDGSGHFTDVSFKSGIRQSDFGLGASWGDYDNDGDLDLYISCFGPNRLYRNNGTSGFVDVTEKAGVGGNDFSTSIAWADYDRDGFLDIYVDNYVQFEYQPADRSRHSRQYESETPFTINPSSYSPSPNRLYHNNGDGSFTDVAQSAGVADDTGRSLGVVWADFNADAWPDLYVANDVSANGVYLNKGNGTFTDIGASSLAADYRGAMGLALADVDHDQDLDLFVTHWLAQENALFENMFSAGLTDSSGSTRLFFMDNAELSGLGQISLNSVGWATGFSDFDHDGYLDLWVVNGSTLQVPDNESRLKPQRMHLYQHQADKGFIEVSSQAIPDLSKPFVGRGGAQADFDGDGLIDIAIQRHGGELILLKNTSQTQNNWIGLRLRQSDANRFAIGALVTVESTTMTQTAQVGGGGSYLSQHATDINFGFKPTEHIKEVTVRWPDGVEKSYQDITMNMVNTLHHNVNYSTAIAK